MKKQLNVLLLFILAITVSSCSTVKSGDSAVPHSVEKYLQENGTDFVHYEISEVNSGNGYNYHKHSYNVYEDIETVWFDYRNTNPVLAFDSHIIDFGIVFNPEDSAVYTSGDSFMPPFGEGQIYILSLKFMGIYSIPVAFKVNKIDSQNKMIEFIYLKNNVSNGFQRIFLKQDYDSKGMPITHIDHVSFFKSEHGFRDKFIYPPFHQDTIDDFHENVFKLNRLSWYIP